MLELLAVDLFLSVNSVESLQYLEARDLESVRLFICLFLCLSRTLFSFL